MCICDGMWSICICNMYTAHMHTNLLLHQSRWCHKPTTPMFWGIPFRTSHGQKVEDFCKRRPFHAGDWPVSQIGGDALGWDRLIPRTQSHKSFRHGTIFLRLSRSQACQHIPQMVSKKWVSHNVSPLFSAWRDMTMYNLSFQAWPPGHHHDGLWCPWWKRVCLPCFLGTFRIAQYVKRMFHTDMSEKRCQSSRRQTVWSCGPTLRTKNSAQQKFTKRGRFSFWKSCHEGKFGFWSAGKVRCGEKTEAKRETTQKMQLKPIQRDHH